jgi:streptogramin lyase
MAQASQQDVRISLGGSESADDSGPAIWFRVRAVEMSELPAPVQVALAAQAKVQATKARGDGSAPASPSIEDMSAEVIAKLKGVTDAFLSAGLVAVSEDGKAWANVVLVDKLARAEPGAGRIHVSQLPPGAAPRLSEAISKLSWDPEAYGRRLASFRGA